MAMIKEPGVAMPPSAAARSARPAARQWASHSTFERIAYTARAAVKEVQDDVEPPPMAGGRKRRRRAKAELEPPTAAAPIAAQAPPTAAAPFIVTKEQARALFELRLKCSTLTALEDKEKTIRRPADSAAARISLLEQHRKVTKGSVQREIGRGLWRQHRQWLNEVRVLASTRQGIQAQLTARGAAILAMVAQDPFLKMVCTV